VKLASRLLREPLVHFLAAGALIYIAWGLWGSREDDAHRIVVDRAALLQYLQYQAKAFEPGTFGREFDAMDDSARQQLIDSFVREEALYREAKALGLDRGDYVMRLRLVQKMEFLLQPSADAVPGEAELQQYLDQHAQMYAVAPSWTFTHVFVDPEQRGASRAQADAVQLLAKLNRAHAGFNDSPRYTDRFAFLQNYVERTPDYIASQFGTAFVQSLQQLPVDAHAWQGPIRSDQGWHLVLLTARTPGRVPTVAEVRERLVDDVKRDRVARGQQQAIDALVAQYRVDLRDVTRHGGKAAR
jgi:hypothetical protein